MGIYYPSASILSAEGMRSFSTRVSASEHRSGDHFPIQLQDFKQIKDREKWRECQEKKT
jgi:hypothetical protein